ncbi:MAG: cytochrome c3 family protein [Saprospiraceae bacterium]
MRIAWLAMRMGIAERLRTCASCHTVDYNESINPKPRCFRIATKTAQPAIPQHQYWQIAHLRYTMTFMLNGAHATIATDCATCHNGDYNNTPNTCASCHNEDYQSAMAPNHATNQFPLDCESCHTEQGAIDLRSRGRFSFHGCTRTDSR